MEKHRKEGCCLFDPDERRASARLTLRRGEKRVLYVHGCRGKSDQTDPSRGTCAARQLVEIVLSERPLTVPTLSSGHCSRCRTNFCGCDNRSRK